MVVVEVSHDYPVDGMVVWVGVEVMVGVGVEVGVEVEVGGGVVDVVGVVVGVEVGVNMITLWTGRFYRGNIAANCEDV